MEAAAERTKKIMIVGSDRQKTITVKNDKFCFILVAFSSYKKKENCLALSLGQRMGL